jgi:hypothetical protein
MGNNQPAKQERLYEDLLEKYSSCYFENQEMKDELESLTRMLFEEANAMVAKERRTASKYQTSTNILQKSLAFALSKSEMKNSKTSLP